MLIDVALKFLAVIAYISVCCFASLSEMGSFGGVLARCITIGGGCIAIGYGIGCFKGLPEIFDDFFGKKKEYEIKELDTYEVQNLKRAISLYRNSLSPIKFLFMIGWFIFSLFFIFFGIWLIVSALGFIHNSMLETFF